MEYISGLRLESISIYIPAYKRSDSSIFLSLKVFATDTINRKLNCTIRLKACYFSSCIYCILLVDIPKVKETKYYIFCL